MRGDRAIVFFFVNACFYFSSNMLLIEQSFLFAVLFSWVVVKFITYCFSSNMLLFEQRFFFRRDINIFLCSCQATFSHRAIISFRATFFLTIDPCFVIEQYFLIEEYFLI